MNLDAILNVISAVCLIAGALLSLAAGSRCCGFRT